MHQPTAAGRCPRPPTGPFSRPSWTACGFGRGAHPGRATRSPPPGGACPWSRWTPAPRSSGRRAGHPARGVRGAPTAHRLLLHVAPRPSPGRAVRRVHVVATQVAELSYLHSRDITFAVFCQGPSRGGLPLPRVHGLGDALVLGGGFPRHAPRRAPHRHMHIVCYLRRATASSNRLDDAARVEATDYSLALLLGTSTVYGAGGSRGRIRPAGWPQRWQVDGSNHRINEHPSRSGSRLEPGASDDLTAGTTR